MGTFNARFTRRQLCKLPGIVWAVACVGTMAPAIGADQIAHHSDTGLVAQAASHLAAGRGRPVDFGAQKPSADARQLANWIAASGDNAQMDFIIVDKKFAKAYVFSAEARLQGASPVLLGAALGDDSAPDIGSRPLAEIGPHERTTPAGRFVAERGHNARGEDVVWVDYDAAVSMHRVITTNPKERRLERLASPSIAEKRISWGCINVPLVFYETTIRPIFANHRAVVYVLPDVKPVREVFGSNRREPSSRDAPSEQ